MHRQI